LLHFIDFKYHTQAVKNTKSGQPVVEIIKNMIQTKPANKFLFTFKTTKETKETFSTFFGSATMFQ